MKIQYQATLFSTMLLCLFQLSTLTVQTKHTYPLEYNFPAPVPLVGQYAQPYLFFACTYFLIPPQRLQQYAPHILNTRLTEQPLHKPYKQYAQVAFHYSKKKDFKKPYIYNIIFHPFAGLLQNKTYFQTHLPVGLFEPHGLTPVDLPTNTFISIDINVHNGNGIHFSPNNARFYIDSEQSICSCWTYAYNLKFSTLTYHIIFLSQQPADLAAVLTKKLSNIIHTKKSNLTFFIQETQPLLLKKRKKYNYKSTDLSTWEIIHSRLRTIISSKHIPHNI